MFRRLLAGGLVALCVVAYSVTPVSAHVTVGPDTATKGGYTTLTFKVPNEEESANTTKIEVGFPTDHPISSVSVEPVPGWMVSVETSKLAKPITSHGDSITEVVSSITWTGKIAPGQFQRFAVSVGPLPDDVDEISFPAIQTYDNGDVVRWVDPPAEGEAAPEHPAPVLHLTAADHEAASPTTMAPASTSVSAGSSSTSGTQVARSDVDRAKTLGIVGIVVGAVALLLAFGALVRRQPSDAASTENRSTSDG